VRKFGKNSRYWTGNHYRMPTKRLPIVTISSAQLDYSAFTVPQNKERLMTDQEIEKTETPEAELEIEGAEPEQTLPEAEMEADEEVEDAENEGGEEGAGEGSAT
jgi:hypothetical protein